MTTSPIPNLYIYSQMRRSDILTDPLTLIPLALARFETATRHWLIEDLAAANGILMYDLFIAIKLAILRYVDGYTAPDTTFRQELTSDKTLEGSPWNGAYFTFDHVKITSEKTVLVGVVRVGDGTTTTGFIIWPVDVDGLPEETRGEIQKAVQRRSLHLPEGSKLDIPTTFYRV